MASNSPSYERRSFPLEVRIDESGDIPTKIVGHAAVFNSLSEEMGGWFGSFRERIEKGAFDEALDRVRSGEDTVYALFNHNPDYIISSTADRTLSLSVDEKGLVAEMTPMDTQTIRDLVVQPIREGKLRKMSFGFTTKDEHTEIKDEQEVRVLDKIARLFDVSPVTYPAYPGTDVQARSLLSALSVDIDSLSMPERAAVRSFISSIARHLPVAQAQAGRAPADPASLTGVNAKIRSRLLELQDRDFALSLIERK